MGTYESLNKETSFKLSSDYINYEEGNSKNYKQSSAKDKETDISCKDTTETMEITKENNKILNNKMNIYSDILVPFKFEYKEKCDNAQITGSFFDWKKKLDMLKNNTTGFHEILIKLPRCIHQFKFIINNQWVCSKDYQITKDSHNNINNIIDLTYFIPEIELQNYENNNNNNDQKIINKEEKEKPKNSIATDFGCNYPNISELNDQPPSILLNYKSVFDLISHSNQENTKYSNRNYLITDHKKELIENNDYKTINTFRHENLSHICSNCSEENKDINYIKLAMSNRFKHKFLTTVYFQPKAL